MGYKYYSTQRPILPGGYPKPRGNMVLEIVNYDNRTYVEEIDRNAWGYVLYEQPLSDSDIANYELKSAE